VKKMEYTRNVVSLSEQSGNKNPIWGLGKLPLPFTSISLLLNIKLNIYDNISAPFFSFLTKRTWKCFVISLVLLKIVIFYKFFIRI